MMPLRRWLIAILVLNPTLWLIPAILRRDGMLGFGFVLVGLLTFAAYKSRMQWLQHLLLILNMVAAFYLISAGFSPFLSLAVVVSALTGWDLLRFEQVARQITPHVNARRITATHLRRLIGALLIGTLVSLAALLFTIPLSFRWAFFLALGVIILFALAASRYLLTRDMP